MANIGHYNPNEHEPRDPIEVLPNGWYGAQIVDTEVVEAKSGNGSYLNVTFELLEDLHPDLGKRKVWARLNLWNANQQAVDIANRELASICKALGQIEPWEDTEVLHFRPLAIKVKVRPARGDYEASNDISGYDAIASRFANGAPVSRGTVSPGGQVAPPPSSAPRPPAQGSGAPRPPAAGQPGHSKSPPWAK